MTLFCGRLNYTNGINPASEMDNLARMFANLGDKGVGEPVFESTQNAVFGWKALTRIGVGSHTEVYINHPASGMTIIGQVRIDNRLELRPVLNKEVHDLKSTTDLALVLAAYQKWGRDSISKLFGDFAFVIFDRRARKILCVRDHAGIVPFFYCDTGKALVFGNDQEMVADAPDVPDDIDKWMVADFLDVEYLMPRGKTFLKSVKRLPPGAFLTIEQNKSKLNVWWQPNDVPDVRFARDSDYIEACQSLMEQSVHQRMPDQGKFGCHLSGGLDSSCISVIANRACKDDGRESPDFYTWIPEEEVQGSSNEPEQKMLNSVVRSEQLSLKHICSDKESMLEFYSRDPVRHPTTNMLWMELPVQKVAHENGVSLIMSGHGGDQCISSTGKDVVSGVFFSGQLARFFEEVNAFNRHPAKVALGLIYSIPNRLAKEVYNSKLFSFRQSKLSYKKRSFVRFNPANRNLKGISIRYGTRRDIIIQSGYIDQRIEGWAEHGSRRGLQYVYPLLDRRLMEFGLGLPSEFFLRRGVDRWLMRQASLKYLPADVTKNKSQIEPLRGDRTIDAIEGAIPHLLSAVQSLDPKSRRCTWVDLDRLASELQEPLRRDGGRSPRFGRKRAALEILDLDLTDT